MKTIVALVSLTITNPAFAQSEFFGDVPQFVEQAEIAGIDHQYRGPFEYFVGGGAASFDCNNDRMNDLFIAGGEMPAKLFRNTSKAGQDITFSEQPISATGEITKVTGAYPINFDNDAHVDLMVLRVGQNQILRGLGDCTFAKANDHFVFDGGDAWTTGFSAIWEQDAANPTLAFANYIDRDAPGSPWGTCEDNVLARPNPNGEYDQNQSLSPSFCSLSIMFTDWNNRGQFDLRVTNDRQYHRGGYEQLWNLNNGGRPEQFDARDGWQKLIIWGMGIAQTDLNADGRPDYALSSMGDTMLQTLDEDAEEDSPIYRDMAYERAATAHRPYQGDDLKPSTGWHTEFADFNNDTRTDLYIAKGNVERMPDFAEVDPDNMLMGLPNGKFSEQGGAAGIALPRRGRGAVIEDFNADGMLDLLVVNREEPVSLFRNLGRKTEWGYAPFGNFLAVELRNTGVNRNAVGAKISVKTGNLTQTHTVQIGGGHASGRLGFIHFGLGVAERAQVRIKWPDGDWSQPYRVFANNFVVLDRDDPDAKYWYPAR
ncbi:hypothetical protein GCM10008927_25370 [Amylibacter ulvae]|uniref:ASPIC/UnbV domain-containing protein n=1 Tax=Paramylibacter ulvae TaxID=1651968 RepID=A0ABQ3D7J2_9RHOB|nr:CRTAC1 family protein [Amylibacter ulvae]GHA58656.1 hypothetical protein GCM10008927_25370 [Amylibacter ulvae]